MAAGAPTPPAIVAISSAAAPCWAPSPRICGAGMWRTRAISSMITDTAKVAQAIHPIHTMTNSSAPMVLRLVSNVAMSLPEGSEVGIGLP